MAANLSDFKLGKDPHKHDDKTLMLADYLEVPVIPTAYDFDRHRAKFPVKEWGNLDYGDCVIAAESNHLLRMERVEQKRTIKLTDDQCIERYKTLTGCEKPGDANDTGLVMLNTMSNWRNVGYQVGKRNYNIAAYGELEPRDDHQLKSCIYLLGGIHFGFALPRSAQAQVPSGFWDVTTGPGSQAGSWGGHCVFSCRYDQGNYWVKTWGMDIRVTVAFVQKYADEVWGVVDDLDKWKASSHLDVANLIAKLRSIGAKNVT
jgi:hypothetical protein